MKKREVTEMKSKITLVAPLVAMAAILLLPLLPIPAFWITLLSYVGLYSIVGLGLVLLTGVAGMTSFGQAAFVGIGAYATAYLTTHYGLSPWIGLLAGLLLTGGSAIVIGSFTMRLSGHYLPLSTIAWGLSLYFLFGNLESLGKYDGIGGVPSISLFDFEFSSGRSMYVLIWIAVILALLSVQNFLNSRPGRAVRALKFGYVMPEAMGVNTPWIKIVIFAYAASVGDLGHDACHMLHRIDDLVHGLAGIIDQRVAVLHLLYRVPDQGLDFTCGHRRTLCQISDFRRHHRKAATLLAGAGRFHRRIECQNIGLKRNAVDDADDVNDLAGTGVD